MKEFEGKVAVITGAGNGFGVEIAKECAYRKIKMILVDIEKEDVELTKKMVDTFLEKGFTYFDTAWMLSLIHI